MNTERINSASVPKQHPITRTTVCEHFLCRKCIGAPSANCWFCKYADFMDRRSEIPEAGVCRYPIRQTK